MTTASTKKTASPFSDKFLEKIKAELTEERERLAKELTKYSKKDPGTAGDGLQPAFPNYGDSEEDNAREVADYEANMTIENDLEKAVRDVAAALDKLKKGTYGICKYCKKTIDEKRLLARPTSSACVECKKTITQEV